MFCGVCHSDIHQVKDEWGNTVYPCVPGHEVVGRVAAVGASVGKVAVGDIVGVGCMIDSCRHCAPCEGGEENYCEGPNSWLATYNGPMVPKAKAETHENMYGRDNTFGGYSDSLVVNEDFVIKIPDAISPAEAAPILCAGVTTFSPMRHFGVQAGDKVGVVGLGGLGHMAVQIAKAMGAEVTVFTSSRDKEDEVAALGATHVVMEKNAESQVEAELKASFDFIISTVPEKHDVNPFVQMLKHDKTLAVVGALEELEPIDNMEVAAHRRRIAGSMIGSLAETREVLDFCAEHGVRPKIEVIEISDINKAYDKVEDGKVHFRYVIDLASLKEAA